MKLLKLKDKIDKLEGRVFRLQEKLFEREETIKALKHSLKETWDTTQRYSAYLSKTYRENDRLYKVIKELKIKLSEK